ncbi:MAG: RIP metalloprotease RseP [Bacteroidales bacterium]|nr:RIP metalloprotease RseP [Bacteroidales bacterium]
MKALQVILALAALILIHEAGHFCFAKMFRIRVDKFFLFMDLGGFKLLSTKEGWFSKICPWFKNNETEYGIGWLPIGGYCKINGMIDESMDMETMKQEPKPWEFRTKPAWQRLLVMAGGVLYNFIFAILAFTLILTIWGDNYIKADNDIYVNELAYDMGFRNGDRILRMDDFVPEDFSMLQADLARRNVHKAVVLRDNDTISIYIDQARIGEVLNTPYMFDIALPFVIDTVPPTSRNAGAGLVRGDRIIAIDSTATPYRQDIVGMLQANAGGSVEATVVRNADTLSVPLQIDSTGMIGVYMEQFPFTHKSYGNFITAIPAGTKKMFSSIGGYVRDLKLVATPSTQAYKSVGSFIAIGQVFPSRWNWYAFLSITALLSIMLGVMNLLPIPGLDGGHILFTIYEMVTGRKPSDSFLAGAQVIGMILLFGLMILAFGNDIGRLIH